MESHKIKFLPNLRSLLISNLQNFFYWYGKFIAKKPWHFIIFCVSISALCSLGLIKFTKENRPFKLWIPQDSDFIKVMAWQDKNFPQQFRIHIAIYEAENVLTKDVFLEVLKIHNEVTKF